MSPSLLRVLTSARKRDEYPMTLRAYWSLYQKFLPRGTYAVGVSTTTDIIRYR